MGVLVFWCTVVGAVGLLSFSAWPGVLEDTFGQFPSICLCLPLTGCWSLLVLGFAVWDLWPHPVAVPKRRWWGVRSFAVAVVAIVLVAWQVPLRLAFVVCESEFRRLAEAGPSEDWRDQELGRQIGLYSVDRYAADRRGGVYFRTHAGTDGIGPDTLSYGFALRPNGEGTPFGNAKYHLNPLFGDWYVFAASNDW
jgi:hypothetical protein